MVRMLDMLSDFLVERRYSHERLDGTVRGDLRQARGGGICRFGACHTHAARVAAAGKASRARCHLSSIRGADHGADHCAVVDAGGHRPLLQARLRHFHLSPVHTRRRVCLSRAAPFLACCMSHSRRARLSAAFCLAFLHRRSVPRPSHGRHCRRLTAPLSRLTAPLFLPRPFFSRSF
eukprot:5423618-Pleurochrysis_carterae.AAC.5